MQSDLSLGFFFFSFGSLGTVTEPVGTLDVSLNSVSWRENSTGYFAVYILGSDHFRSESLSKWHTGRNKSVLIRIKDANTSKTCESS